ncbi:MAG: sulfotransferase family protein [Anaerolineales bacterium]|nr:sulfotransferase family protein [Anaerolineales bacterium]
MNDRHRTGLTEYLNNHAHPRGIIVCPEKKFIYMKAKKIAGASILRGVLEPQIPGIIHQKEQPEEFRTWLDGINDRILEEYFIFAIVRNPWDRVISITSYFDIPLDDFLSRYDYYCKEERIRIHSLPLYLYTHNEGSQFVDTICRYESLQPDMNLVFDQINIPRTRLPYLNTSEHQHYSTYYKQDEIDQVEKLYRNDIAFFGYMFEDNIPGKTSSGEGPYSRLFSKLRKNN